MKNQPKEKQGTSHENKKKSLNVNDPEVRKNLKPDKDIGPISHAGKTRDESRRYQ